jgi:RHS repeat-associated protein
MSQQYTGRENDGTGLMYYRARYYHAGCARFISEDPIGWASGQTNNYAYVGGDPVSFTDPSGHVPLPVITGVIGGISGGAGYVVGKLVSGGCIRGRELGVAIGVGAVQGALAPFAPGIGGAIGLGAATNLTQDAINGAADGKILSPREVALSLGLGGLSGAIAGA